MPLVLFRYSDYSLLLSFIPTRSRLFKYYFPLSPLFLIDFYLCPLIPSQSHLFVAPHHLFPFDSTISHLSMAHSILFLLIPTYFQLFPHISLNSPLFIANSCLPSPNLTYSHLFSLLLSFFHLFQLI